MTVWKYVQTAILSVDVGVIYSLGKEYYMDGRTVGKWFAGDWVNWVLTISVGILRIAFLMEIGYNGEMFKKEYTRVSDRNNTGI